MIGVRIGTAIGPVIGTAIGIGVDPLGAGARNIVLMLGQSNAQGKGDYHTLTDQSLVAAFPQVSLKQQIAITNDNALTWTFYATAPLQPRGDDATINMGPELRLGHYLNNAIANRWAIAKAAVGSSNLNVNWLPSGTYPGSQPNLFTQAMTFATNAKSELGGKIAAVVWIQGESDATDTTMASNYQTNLLALIDAIRASFPGVPFIYNRLTASSPATFASTVRTAQTNVAGLRSGVTMVNCDDCALQVDNIHFTADGYDLLGKRFALGVLAQLGINVPPVANFTSVTTGLSVAFTRTSTDDDGTIVTHRWDFGDGSTSTASGPTHVYASGATYNVTLTETDNSGGTNSITKPVTAVNQTWEVDGSGNWAVPATAQHWTDLLNNFAVSMSAPDLLLDFQAASGNLTDIINALVFTASGAPTYNAALPAGWTRKGIQFADGVATQRFRSSDVSLPDISASAILLLVYLIETATPAAARGVFGCGTISGSDAEARLTTGNAARMTDGANTGSGASGIGTTVVRPWLLLHDPTVGSTKAELVNDLEVVIPTFSASAAGQRIDFGATNGASAGPYIIGYAAGWFGSKAHAANARSVRKALLQACNWTIPWS